MSNETFLQKRYEFQAKLQRIQAEQRAKAPPVAEVAPAKVGVYRGVYRTGEHYGENDSATWGGSVWVAREDTDDAPGGGSSAWTLAVKRGGQGEQGPRGPKGEQGPEGPPGPKPDHRWHGTALAFERPDGTFEQPVDLRGPPGSGGSAVGGGVVVMPSFSWMPNGW